MTSSEEHVVVTKLATLAANVVALSKEHEQSTQAIIELTREIHQSQEAKAREHAEIHARISGVELHTANTFAPLTALDRSEETTRALIREMGAGLRADLAGIARDIDEAKRTDAENRGVILGWRAVMALVVLIATVASLILGLR